MQWLKMPFLRTDIELLPVISAAILVSDEYTLYIQHLVCDSNWVREFDRAE